MYASRGPALRFVDRSDGRLLDASVPSPHETAAAVADDRFVLLRERGISLVDSHGRRSHPLALGGGAVAVSAAPGGLLVVVRQARLRPAVLVQRVDVAT